MYESVDVRTDSAVMYPNMSCELDMTQETCSEDCVSAHATRDKILKQVTKIQRYKYMGL
jgi:hypothetical protein